MRLLKLSILLAIFSFTISTAQVGSEFWFAAPDLSYTHAKNGIPLKLHISAIYSTAVTISRPADPSFTPIKFNLAAGQTQQVRMDNDINFNSLPVDDIETYSRPTSDDNFIQNKGFLIEAHPGEISVYYEPEAQNNSDFASLKGENGLGRDFWVSTQRRYTNHVYTTGAPNDTYSGFTVVATEDCDVLIDPKGNNLEYHGTAPFSVTLRKGESFAVRAAGQAPEEHIHGVHVTSTGDVAIMIFDDSIEFLTDRKGWDLFLDQTVPTSITGLEYIVLKGETTNRESNSTDGEAIFATPTEDNTDIYVNGTLAASNLNAGDYFEYVINDTHLSTHVRSTNPIYVNHICGYNNFLSATDGGELGGAVLPPIDVCTGSSEVTVKRSPTNGFHFGINLMVRNDTSTGSALKNQSIENFTYTINGNSWTQIPPSHFTFIMDSAFAIYDRYKAGGDAFFLNVTDGDLLRVSNTTSRFHMGAILGKSTPGNKYGYFSDFGYSQASAGIGGYTQPPKGIFCDLSPVQLVAGGGVTYLWEPRYEKDSALASLLSNDTIAAPFFTPDTIGDFHFRVNITGECQSVDSLYLLVKTRENNEAKFTISADTSCSPFAPTLTNLSNTTDGDRQLWTITPAVGSPYEINQDTIPRIFDISLPDNNTNSIQTHKVELMVVSSDNSCPVTSTKNITIQPPVNAGFNVSDTAGCDTLWVDFTNTSEGDISGANYYWEFGDGSSSTLESPSHFYSAPGNYEAKLTATSELGCANTYSQTIHVYEKLGADFSSYIDTVFCSPTGGIAPYSIKWKNGATGNYYVAPTSGWYTATITDADGCIYTDSIELVIPKLAFRAYHKDASCVTCTDGKAWVNIERATTPVTVLWSNTETTDTTYNLSPDTYWVTVSDENSNSITDSVIVGTAPPSLNLNGTNIDCFGDSTGTIDLTITGGSAPMEILWSNGSTSEDLSNLPAGKYTVSVSDAANQTTTDSITITQNQQFIMNATTSDILCQGEGNGAISLSIAGGTAPYTYSWSNGDTTNTINNLNAGTHSLQLTDIKGCSQVSSFTIHEPDALIIQETIIDASTDSTSDGSILLDISGGVPPFAYLWSNGATEKDLDGLATGTYELTITDSSSCIFTSSYTVSIPAPFLSIEGKVSNITCNGEANGSIDIELTGAAYPVSYEWSTGDTCQNLANLSAGIYTLIATDADDQSDTASFQVHEPADIIIKSDIDNGGCYTEDFASIEVEVTGGQAPYKFLWSTGATTNKIEKLTEGIYTLEVIDANKCSQTWQGQIYGVGVSSISGYARYSKGMLSSDATVYLIDASAKPHEIAHETRLSESGYFEFVDIKKGFYLVYVKLDNHAKQKYQGVMSSYYQNTHKWKEAEILYLPCGENQQITIDLFENQAATNSGSCTAEGTVIKDKGWVKSNSKRASDVTVSLVNNDTGIPVDHTFTNEKGAYKFQDIAIGNYSIYVDIAGVKHNTTHNFTVEASSTVFKHLDFYADLASSLTIIKADFQLSLDEDFSDNNAIMMYPNPVINMVTLELASIQDEEIEFALLASNGDVILMNEEYVHNGKAVIDFSMVTTGTYIAIIKSSSGVFSKKVIVK